MFSAENRLADSMTSGVPPSVTCVGCGALKLVQAAICEIAIRAMIR